MNSRFLAFVCHVVCSVSLSLSTAHVFAANTTVTWNFTVTPSTVNLSVGDTVTFSGSLSSHPPSAADSNFAAIGSPLASSGSTFVQSFQTVGTFYFVCAFHNSMRLTANVTNACNPPASPAVMDIDGNGQVDAGTDGLLFIRYLLGLRGNELTNGAMGNCPGRATAASIEQYLATRVVP